MKVGSLFAGVGGFDIAVEAAGMEVAWQSEVDPHASKVLEHHWPGRNLGDIHNIRIGLDPDGGYARAGNITDTADRFNSRDSVTASDHKNGGTDDRITAPAVDVLCGGFPCQDYSVAGNREGLAGDRGALWWEFHRLITEGRPTWVVAENVPGLLSSRGGRDFATIVDSLVELGYGVVWGVLDAQFFGVAQRRRRVFLVGHSGGRPRPEVLALSEGLFGHPAPSREAGERVAASVSTRVASGSDDHANGNLVASTEPGAIPDVATTITARSQQSNAAESGQATLLVSHDPHPSLTARTGKSPNVEGGEDALVISSSGQDTIGSLTTTFGPKNYSNLQEVSAGSLVAFAQNQRDELRDLDNVAGALAAEPGMKQQTYVATSIDMYNQTTEEEIHHALRTGSGDAQATVQQGMTVRRLTPLECERLQGFPDGWTDVVGMSDSQRYKQMGNAVAVPVVEWIMGRVASTHALDNGGVG